MTELVDSCPLAPSIEPLTERVAALETSAGELKEDVAGVKIQMEGIKTQVENVAAQASQVSDDTAAIRAAILGATRVGTFIKRHGGKVGGTVFGIAVGAGFFSQATLNKFDIILKVILGH